jgi:ABC-type multidrug transport system permease subunit
MFTLLVMLTSGAVLLVVERRQGLLRRLASAPVSRRGVVLAKWTARMIIGAIQIGFAMVVGTLLFHMDWGPNLGALLGVMAAYAGFCAALALVVGSLARSEGQAVAGGVIAANVLAALGGCWWPIEVTPKWMQELSLFLPTGLTMDALHSLVHFGAPAATVLPHVGVLIGGALVLGLMAGRVFRFE